jgi:formate dehydrogenase beta subunit
MTALTTRSQLSLPLGTADDLRGSIRRNSKLKGRQPEAQAIEDVRACMAVARGDTRRRDLLIEHLHRINDAFRGLRRRHLVALSLEMKIPMAEVYEVASFYHHFEILDDDQGSAMPSVRVCEGLTCELAGARELLAELTVELGSEMRVLPSPCMGRCEQAPFARVQRRGVSHATTGDVAVIARSGADAHVPPTPGADFQPAQWAGKSIPPAPVSGTAAASYTDYDTYMRGGGYQIAAAVVQEELCALAVLEALENSGLRGLGGAGFPAGRKWRIVRDQAAPRLLAVNIDEGEPGTFKDRTYLERDPHRFLEGVLVAAQVVRCDAVYIYLRDEYHECRDILSAELARLLQQPPCPLPQIELRRGAGAYICGEESAMIESIEGKRGEPRLRPPYIAQVGLFGRPTLEHNFETLYWVRDIVERGPAWFTSFGRNGRKGLRSFSVSGRVRDPGVKLAPAGITLRQLVEEYCGGMQEGHDLYAYLPGGASGGILPASLADVPLDFDTLQPHGAFIGSAAVIVLGHRDKARDAALNVMRFFAQESCGQCTPCRVGTDKAARLLEAPRWDLSTLGDLARVMADASICGLGQAAPNPIECVRKYFRDEI